MSKRPSCGITGGSASNWTCSRLHPIAPGSPFFHPKGAVVYNTLVQYMRSLYGRYGYTEVITPLIYKTELWKTSGHYDAFRDDMFLMAVEDDEYGVKPMNCPGHCYLVREPQVLVPRSADPLRRLQPAAPLRAPRGRCAGLTRVRSFAQDDAHIYCTPEQLDGELAQFVAMTREVYGVFGFDRVEVTLQTRPEKFLGRLELWDAAEAALRRALEHAGYAVTVLPGEGAFYGPKIGFDFRDVLERSWTLATVQIDCAMPERFGLEYVTSEGSLATPVMVHRAVLGSLERFIAILLEHTAGHLPLWLAPVQVRVLTLTERQEEYGRAVTAALRARRGAGRPGRPQRKTRLQGARGAIAENPIYAGRRGQRGGTGDRGPAATVRRDSARPGAGGVR